MSSGGYANRLSDYPDKGICGLPESFESARTVQIKLAKLVELVRRSDRIVVLTGAGVSTSAGIPDFRGPKGIWTVEEREAQAKAREERRARKRRKVMRSKARNADGGGGGGGDSKTSSGADAKEAVAAAAAKTTAIEAGGDASANNHNGAADDDCKPRPQCDGGPKLSDFYNSPSRVSSSQSAATSAPAASAAVPAPTGTVAAMKRTRDDMSSSSNNNKNHNGSPSATELKESTTPSFEAAQPTYTHRAITKLAQVGKVRYVITQNVDGLHRRSGLPRSRHAVLHGCVFTEKCEDCGREYFRDFDLGGVSFQKTGRKCTGGTDTDADADDNGTAGKQGCGGDLRDTILDWDDALPEDDWDRAQEECEAADLVLALGTSLRIEPAGSLPLRAKKFVIVNLQVTPLDDEATLIIKERVDRVMEHLLRELNIELEDAVC
jgi:NAD-dependent SIR2 family protein deacetylase